MTYIEQVGAVLNKIDSDPAVLAAFKELLEGILGRQRVDRGLGGKPILG